MVSMNGASYSVSAAQDGKIDWNTLGNTLTAAVLGEVGVRNCAQLSFILRNTIDRFWKYRTLIANMPAKRVEETY